MESESDPNKTSINEQTPYILETLKCPVCLELCFEAVECSVCSTLFCESCAEALQQKKCPLCNTLPFKVIPSKVARRLINGLPRLCPQKCGFKGRHSEINGHLRLCPERVYKCLIEKCDFQGKKDQFFEHVCKTHQSNICEDYDCNLKKPVYDLLEPKKNDRGFVSRLGVSGLFYCGQVVEYRNKCRCDGRCGPTNGCCCISCMKLNIKFRNLPKYYFLNTGGYPCKKGTNNQLCCMRKMNMGSETRCDGVAFNCSECQHTCTNIQDLDKIYEEK